MSEIITTEFVGIVAGAINVYSTWPSLRATWRKAKAGPRNTAEIHGRAWQLAANLIWFGYGCLRDSWSVYLTTGFMSMALIALLIQLHK